ncbi:Bud3p KNAG_0I01250 [Huiozyma naganishii CBS 8797]|uniref:DH domain-containing protein n=1 Tax=Huiozyma naganishii (strain ATCC MYA-139 / BCRC 22969 / CBS 8797 / KCTC 17520 / NBRC 10181 / NCYC 3082 / Yp74L-3) TaxID=1071383 RepID=J7SA52_HUIN7|nr:hypothetical protein KNAG_0I01250 [Kazachstania naganishii CBS 8797]CCK71916.1 hypothetical protein KNAG_0I01250 [Kazachstania naganishii CBS 8797]
MVFGEVSSVYSAGEDGSSFRQIELFHNLVTSLKEQQTFCAKPWNEKTLDLFQTSVVYYSTDDLIWGPFFICILKDKDQDKICSLVLDKLGITFFSNLDITSNSKYYPAIENLVAGEQSPNVLKCIAVSMLEKITHLSPKQIKTIAPSYLPSAVEYDQTHAGELADSCKLFTALTPRKFGEFLYDCGLLGEKVVKSLLLDVVYENNQDYIDDNNKLVSHLGEQLEQLFNPITEYSPEQTEYGYRPPEGDRPTEKDGKLIKTIVNELLQFQSNFTFNLVEFLQNFLIPLRIKALNDEIPGLSTVKLNRLFPPTIDEVTRINCIFLDSLKLAIPYGSLEVLNACSLTIPYFYKAYTRHEAATKNFSKDIKLFLRNFQDVIPQKKVYTELKIETIMKGPQEKLLKLKLIIDRIWQKKEKWTTEENERTAKKSFDNIIDVIDSFGKLEKPTNSYSTRVFTPSGKLLTELAKGWPVELQYKWLKRRVVGVYDIIDTSQMETRKILVIFSDYLVILKISDYKKYYLSDIIKKPQISDILMNSLINEQPLPAKLPKLQVENSCYIDDVTVSLFNGDSLKFDGLKGENAFSLTCKLAAPESTTAIYVADLITKAKVLEKDTAFHLFKASQFGQDHITLYSTAHESEAYNSERIKSPYALFLNCKPSDDVLKKGKLELAIFARFVDRDNELENPTVQLDVVCVMEPERSMVIQADEMVETLIRILSHYISNFYYSINSKNAHSLMVSNLDLINKVKTATEQITHEPINNETPIKHVSEELKKSYGTITTFRSDVSDMKDAENKSSANLESANKVSLKGIGKEKSVTETNKAKKTDEPSMRKDTTTKPAKVTNASKSGKKIRESEVKKSRTNEHKRKSIIGVFKDMFGSKKNKNKKSQISRPVIAPQQKSPKKSNFSEENHMPTPTSERKIKSATTTLDNKPRSANTTPTLNANEPIYNNNLDTPEQLRISSVVRNMNYTGNPVLSNWKDRVSEPQNDVSVEQSGLLTENAPGSLQKTIISKTNKQSESPVFNEAHEKQHSTSISGSSVPKSELEKECPVQIKDQTPSKNLQDTTVESRQNENTLDSTDMTHSTLQTRDIINKELVGEAVGQNRMFNDDLFGDFAESKPKEKNSRRRNGERPTSKAERASSQEKDVGSGSDLVSESISKSAVETINDDEIKEKEVETATLREEDLTSLIQENERLENETEMLKGKVINELNQDLTELEKLEVGKGATPVKKTKIFPHIPPMSPPKRRISFQRSPSFAELFQGMKTVLDERDARYNWKRLPSEMSLDDSLLLNSTSEITSKPSRNGSRMKKMAPVPEEPKTDVKMNHVSDQDSTKQAVNQPLDRPNSNASGRISAEVEGVVDAMFQRMPAVQTTSKPPSPTKTSSPFRVVNASPTKYVNRRPISPVGIEDDPTTFQPQRVLDPRHPATEHVSANSSNATSDYFLPSDVNEESEKRWLEFSYASQDATHILGGQKDAVRKMSNETLEERNYLTPLEDPTEVFRKEEKVVDDDGSSMVHEDKFQNVTAEISSRATSKNNSVKITSPQPSRRLTQPQILVKETIQPKSNATQKTEPLLDDMEFSSFNMTFDTSIVTDNDHQSQTQSNDLLIKGGGRPTSEVFNGAPTLIASRNSQPNPTVYRLSRDMFSGLSAASKPNQTFGEEDPIWISPSKINFNEMSKISPEKADGTKVTVTEQSPYNLLASSSKQQKRTSLASDSSFAFLANFLDGDGNDLSTADASYRDDKPTRLHFV